MQRIVVGGLAAWLMAVVGTATTAQSSAERHRETARLAAGNDLLGLFNRVCGPASLPAPPRSDQRSALAAAPQGPPPRESWHVEPAKVFDNLYFVGQSEYSAWAVNTSDGIIVIDTIFDYSVEDEIVLGLKKLGLDPSRIKYAVVSHSVLGSGIS